MLRLYWLTLYDHLGRAVLLNLLWAAAVVPWVAAGAGLAAVGSGLASQLEQPALHAVGLAGAAALVLWSPPTFFLVAASRGWLGGDASLGAAWRLTRRQAVRAQVAGLAVTGAVVLLLGNAVFYAGRAGLFGMALAGVMLWLLVGVGLLSVYLFPRLAAAPDAGLRPSLRDAALLALAGPGRAFGLLVGGAAWLALGIVSGVGLALGALTGLALLGNLGLARAFEAGGGPPLPRDGRGWRDLVRPWQ